MEISNEVIQWSILKLKEHPQYVLYNSELTPGEEEALEDSISKTGIQEALLIQKDGTILSGLQRKRMALRLGLAYVPVREVQCNPSEALYLMVASNDTGRGKKEKDLIKKARRVQVLYEYGRSRDKTFDIFGQLPTLTDEEAKMKRLMKLLYLTPELQKEVSAGRIGQQVAYKVACLNAYEQKQFYFQYQLQQMSAKQMLLLVDQLDQYEPHKKIAEEKKKAKIQQALASASKNLDYLILEALSDDQLQFQLADLIVPNLYRLHDIMTKEEETGQHGEIHG